MNNVTFCNELLTARDDGIRDEGGCADDDKLRCVLLHDNDREDEFDAFCNRSLLLQMLHSR